MRSISSHSLRYRRMRTIADLIGVALVLIIATMLVLTFMQDGCLGEKSYVEIPS